MDLRVFTQLAYLDLKHAGVIEGRRKLHDEQINNLYYSPSFRGRSKRLFSEARRLNQVPSQPRTEWLLVAVSRRVK